MIAGVDSSGTPNKAAYDAASGKRQEDAFAWFAGTDMALTPDVVYLVSADGVCAVNRASYASAVEEAKRLDAERQTLEQQLNEFKKIQAAANQPAAAEDLAKQIEEHTQQLNQTAAKRRTTKRLRISLASQRKAIHNSDAGR